MSTYGYGYGQAFPDSMMRHPEQVQFYQHRDSYSDDYSHSNGYHHYQMQPGSHLPASSHQQMLQQPTSYAQSPTPAYSHTTSSRSYNQGYYGNGMSAPQEIMLSPEQPHATHRMLTPLVLPSQHESPHDSSYGMQASFSGDSDDNSATTPTSPMSASRRHPVHPEGTPQPKGRGARKPTKPDDATKTLPCDGCNSMFARKHDLDRHRRIHTLEAPYVCRGCRRSYRRSDARKRHWDQEPACSVLHVRNSSERPAY